MANDALSSGEVVVSANADRLVKGLNDASKKTKAWGQGLTRELGQELQQEFGRRTLLGGVIGGATGAGVVGVVAEIGASALGFVADAATGMKELNERLKETTTFVGMIEKGFERGSKLAAEWRGALVSPADVVQSLEEDMERTLGTFRSLKADWKTAADDLKGMGEHSGERALRFVLGKDAEALKLSKDRADAFIPTLTKLAEHFRALELAKERALDPRQDPAKIGAINKALAELNDQLTTFAMNDIDKQLFQLEKLGATAAELAGARDMLIALRERQEARKAEEERQKQMAKMMQDLAAAGVQGAIDRANELARERNLDRLAGAVEAGTAEGYSLSVRNQFGGAGGEGMRQVHDPANEAKLDAVAQEIRDFARNVEEALKKVGVF